MSCTNVPIQVIPGDECIGDSLPKINQNFATIGENLCLALSAINSLSANPVGLVSSLTIDFSTPANSTNQIRADIKPESIKFEHLAFDGGHLSYRNKIINGEMNVSQRHGVVPITIDSSTPTYSVDRWYGFANRGSVGSGSFTLAQINGDGMNFSLKAKILSTETTMETTDSYGIAQKIEGYNIRELKWGTVDALPLCLSFWVKSTDPGVYGGSLTNGSGTRSFTFDYQTTSTNWEHKAVLIPGDVTGAWNVEEGIGAILYFSLGEAVAGLGLVAEWSSGNRKGCITQKQLILTQGAELSFTQVQLEIGSVNTPFETRPYNVEVSACKRYFEKSYKDLVPVGTQTTENAWLYEPQAMGGNIDNYILVPYTVEKRSIPGTAAVYSPTTGTKNKIAGSSDIETNPSIKTGTKVAVFKVANPLNLSTGFDYSYHWAIDAEL